MLKRAKQVRVRECLDDNKFYEFDAIQVDDMLIAMDNGSVLDAKADWIKIIKEIPWYNVSFDDEHY